MGMSDVGLDINNCYFRQTPGKRGGVNYPSVYPLLLLPYSFYQELPLVLL